MTIKYAKNALNYIVLVNWFIIDINDSLNLTKINDLITPILEVKKSLET